MLGRKRNQADCATQIDRVLRDVERRRAAGALVDSNSVRQAHPQLMPELGDRLQALEQIESAARRAQQIGEEGRTAAETEVVDEFLAEEWRNLSDALPEYDLLEPLRHGGQGIVYRAVERATGRAVAIKVLLDGPLASERQRQRFAREIELDSRLRHPNIVTLFHSGTVRGRPFFAMEYIDGLPVDDYAWLRELSGRDIVGLFVQIARAIMYAHQRGIIHRDIKPSNILIDADGHPHLLDFGLAKDLAGSEEDTDPSPSRPGSVVGTLPYLSPEQVDADGDVDTRSDIYALAVVLFEVLAGVLPYPVDGDPRSIRRNILDREPARLSDVVGDLDGGDDPTAREFNDDLEAILLMALDKDKTGRYQTMGEFADDLERYLAGDAVHAKSDRRFYVLRKTVRKYRIPASVAAMFLGLLITSTVLVTTQWLRARRERDHAREAAQVAHSVLLTTLDNMIEKLSRLAGGIEVRDLFLDGVEDDLDRLDALMESTEAVAELRAAWYEQRGNLAYTRGHRTEAADQYRLLVEIQRSRGAADPSPQNQQALAVALGKLAQESSEWDDLFGEASAIAESLIVAAPDAPEARKVLCKIRVAYARRLFDAGEHTRTAKQIDKALELANPMMEHDVLDDEWSELLADAYECDGYVRVPLGQAQRAEASLERSLRIRQALLDDHPLDVTHARRVMLIHTRLGDLKRDAGLAEEAEALFLSAVSMGKNLAQRDPYDAMVQVCLCSAYGSLASFYMNRKGDGDLQHAVEYSAERLRIVREYIVADPESTRWRRRLGVALKQHGKMLLACWQAGDATNHLIDAAYTHLTDALTEFELLRSGGYDEIRVAVDISYAHDWLVETCRELGRPDEELCHARESYEIRSELHRMNPDVMEYAKQVIVAQAKIANWHFDQETLEHNRQADEWCAKADALLRSLFESGKLVGREEKFRAWQDKIAWYRGQLAERFAQQDSCIP